MKPTEKQIKVIDVILSIIKTWKNTNDIDSPTLSNDIHEFLYADLENEDIIYSAQTYELDDSLRNLLYAIQTICSQLEGSDILYKGQYLEFQHDNLSTELKTYNQVEEEKHWQDVREKAAIAAMQSLISKKYDASDRFLLSSSTAVDAVEYANELVKQLKGG